MLGRGNGVDMEYFKVISPYQSIELYLNIQ